jgi:hypothetical protein
VRRQFVGRARGGVPRQVGGRCHQDQVGRRQLAPVQGRFQTGCDTYGPSKLSSTKSTTRLEKSSETVMRGWRSSSEGTSGAMCRFPAGGIYLCDSAGLAQSHLTKHRGRLAALGVAEASVCARVTEVNERLSQRTRGPLADADASYTKLATVRVADDQRILEVFSSAGLGKRRAHGSKGASSFDERRGVLRRLP